MTTILAYLNFVAFIAGNLVVAWCAYRAYQKVPHRGFMFWVIASVLMAIVIPLSWVLMKDLPSSFPPVLYAFIQELLYLVAIIFGVSGTLLFLLDYIKSTPQVRK